MALALAALVGEAAAQADTRAAVERLFRETPRAEWFTEAFVNEVPPERLAELIDGLTEQFGPLQAVSGEGSRLSVELESAQVPTRVALDAEGRIATLFFEAPVPTAGSIEEHVATIAALPGKTSVLVISDSAVLAAHESDAALAVGSAAKLAILKALDEAAAAGRLAWDQVVALDPAWHSLPTGILQGWPADTPLTLATLANLMISISDNTATDALLDIVGRDRVEAVTPRNTPFPSTAELFKLKAAGNEALRTAWLEGSEAEKRAVLDELRTLPLPQAEALSDPLPTVEWFMSAEEICVLLEALAALPAFQINPGLANKADWAGVAFKGGSDAGALNFSTLLTDTDGRKHCVVATWNDSGQLAQERLAVPYRGLLQALRKGDPAAPSMR